ncbi:hypothetical protein GQ55_2G320400 [Panicum hallii var. hallii]|uniref:Uncharacterized protein n=1 Tax=Panicum hallii var. hallii TaxID=1504633 RepID=A0A2T7EUM9_9POAL|nr:hypothetical protein GQ55_2G320400 [Panicum hallii var. hallii]
MAAGVARELPRGVDNSIAPPWKSQVRGGSSRRRQPPTSELPLPSSGAVRTIGNRTVDIEPREEMSRSLFRPSRWFHTVRRKWLRDRLQFFHGGDGGGGGGGGGVRGDAAGGGGVRGAHQVAPPPRLQAPPPQRYPLSLHWVAACGTGGLWWHNASATRESLQPAASCPAGLAEHASPKERSQHQLAFVDLEKSCCRLLTNIEANDTVLELVSIQDRFSAKYPVDAAVDVPVIQPGITKQMSGLPERTIDAECTDNHVDDRTLLVVDLSSFLKAAQIALPSLNGWLLDYPVTYLFRNGSAEVAIQNLSKHSLHIYRVYVCGSYQSGAKQSEEELMSFSVPCGLSTKRREEPWAKSFIARMSEKLRRCSQVWKSVRLEVEVFHSQSQVIVL